MADRDSNIANFFETTLSASMGSTDTTATVVDTTNGPSSPCYVVVEPESASQREVIYMDGTFTSTTFVTTTTDNRYLDGSAAGSGLTHPSGSVVWVAVLAQHIEDLHDRIDAVSDHGDLDGLSDDDHSQYLNNSRHDARDHSTALSTASIDDLSDVDTSGASTDDALVFDGDEWVPGTGGTQIATGTYTGDDTSDRTITVGFEPTYLQIVNITQKHSYECFADGKAFRRGDTGGGAWVDDATYVQSAGFAATGFVVSGSSTSTLNDDTSTYRWVAWG